MSITLNENFEKISETPKCAPTKPLRKLKKKNLLSFNERSVRAMSVFGLNHEGYPDPTAATAIANVIKAEKEPVCWDNKGVR